MKNVLRAVVAGGTVLAAGGSITALAASVPDFSMHGFPTVAASASIPANSSSSTTLKVNGATFTIPAMFSTDPVKFEVLEGKLSNFTSNAPSGQMPVYDFAFKVMDTKTNMLVGKFSKPVKFSYTNSQLSSKSMYYNVSTTGTYSSNPKTMTITGHTMTHMIAGDPVGWVVTSPSSMVSKSTSPVTGLPISTWLYSGLGLIAAGGILVAFRKKVS
ncbi:hypothetical protein [Alicyclobacillus sp. SO9]|uniref:hypothetical protein n=1 Tax=Alicyclobacillus sp. SO9 TaxID=2665646 RepID=UPI0018E8F825|nr:hypothetical protein [Alicyclobacillus sp. SO9]QQE80103.1 hypothetical protein GI364_06485 [Alicyclobacillus sp. SO9]